MRLTEFRIMLPLTVDEYKIGQLYSTTEMSKNETGGGDGVKILEDKPFSGEPIWDDHYDEGQYTLKKYFLQNKVNAFVKKMAPRGSLEFEEEAWNSYPYCRTTVRNNAYMKDNFFINIETIHAADKGSQENAHKLSDADLKNRKVVFIDITDKKIKSDKEDANIDEFKSTETDRGPLTPGWTEDESLPVMCCYKLVRCEFKWFGLQTMIENTILKNQRKLFGIFNRRVFLWIDRWHQMSLEDVREFEKAAKDELEEAREAKETRGGFGMDD